MRKVSKEKYIIAGLITFGIFFLGLLLGLVIEGKRADYIEFVGREQNLDFSSLQLQYAYIDQLSQEKDCEAVSKTFEENIKSLESARVRLETFDKDAKLDKDEFNLLKREYILAQVRYWLLAKRTKDICNRDIVTLLYFFSDTKNCPTCDEQSFILTYLKMRFKEKLLIFALDARHDSEPIITILKKTYDINEYPTIIVEDKKFSGFLSKEKLLKEICKYYHSKIEDCIYTNTSKK